MGGTLTLARGRETLLEENNNTTREKGKWIRERNYWWLSSLSTMAKKKKDTKTGAALDIAIIIANLPGIDKEQKLARGEIGGSNGAMTTVSLGTPIDNPSSANIFLEMSESSMIQSRINNLRSKSSTPKYRLVQVRKFQRNISKLNNAGFQLNFMELMASNRFVTSKIEQHDIQYAVSYTHLTLPTKRIV